MSAGRRDRHNTNLLAVVGLASLKRQDRVSPRMEGIEALVVVPCLQRHNFQKGIKNKNRGTQHMSAPRQPRDPAKPRDNVESFYLFAISVGFLPVLRPSTLCCRCNGGGTVSSRFASNSTLVYGKQILLRHVHEMRNCLGRDWFSGHLYHRRRAFGECVAEQGNA